MQVLGDLYRIHAERIAIYMNILQKSDGMDLDLKSVIERIIEESIKLRKQLEKMIEPEAITNGEIYKSWNKTAKPMIGTDKKTVLKILADDELLMSNTYSMALSKVNEPDLENLLETQQQALKNLHAHIRQYHNAQ